MSRDIRSVAAPDPRAIRKAFGAAGALKGVDFGVGCPEVVRKGRKEPGLTVNTVRIQASCSERIVDFLVKMVSKCRYARSRALRKTLVCFTGGKVLVTYVESPLLVGSNCEALPS
jgi:hypothetical protein